MTVRKRELMQALFLAGAYEADARGGFLSLHALTRYSPSNCLPNELKLADSNYSSTLVALEKEGLVESHFIGEQHLLWRLTETGRNTAERLRVAAETPPSPSFFLD